MYRTNSQAQSLSFIQLKNIKTFEFGVYHISSRLAENLKCSRCHGEAFINGIGLKLLILSHGVEKTILYCHPICVYLLTKYFQIWPC